MLLDGGGKGIDYTLFSTIVLLLLALRTGTIFWGRNVTVHTRRVIKMFIPWPKNLTPENIS